MANDCLPQVQACAMRVAVLGPDGVPLPGSDNLYVSSALIRVGFAWVQEEGTEITQVNACGERCVDYKSPNELRRGTVTIELCTPDPELASLLSGGTVLTDGDAVGFGAPRLGSIVDAPVSIELWAKRIRNKKLDPTFPYAWWAYPFVTNLRPQDHEHANAALLPSFVGEAYENENWYDGPLNDWPVASDSVYQWVPTTSIPEPSCGFQTLSAS